jgi:hypothetical protein
MEGLTMKKTFVCLSAIISAVLFLSSVCPAGPVTDTGQIGDYTTTFGEDSDYTCNPPSYSFFFDVVVVDSVTGLMWQKATAPPGTYTWAEAVTYCDNLTIGGYYDWRLPTIKELAGITSYRSSSKLIDILYFPDTFADVYWSSTDYVLDTTNAWGMNFSGGMTMYGKGGKHYVRAVRGGQTANNFVDNNDGTITDTDSGLTWQQATAPGTYTWEQALVYCESLALGNHSDWRLPAVKELQSIADYSRTGPAINTTFFSDTQTGSNMYWSSTTRGANSSDTWNVTFDKGTIGYGNKPFPRYVRAVRGGQCEIIVDLVVLRSGSGFGSVTSDPEGIDCGNWCSASFAGGGTVTLTAAADAGSVFSGWSGDCIGNGECTVIMDTNRLVTAVFNKDTDNDGIADEDDNCPAAYNPDQSDADGNGIGDECDAPYWKNLYQHCQSDLAECCNPTSVTFSFLSAEPGSRSIQLTWTTETEKDNAGFNIWRADGFRQINSSLIPALGSAIQGAQYSYRDALLNNGKPYFYLLEDIDTSGISTFHGPVNATPRLLYGIGK